jgi:hypothetical protein
MLDGSIKYWREDRMCLDCTGKKFESYLIEKFEKVKCTSTELS